MTNARIYLDYNATAPLLPEARAALLAALDATGNASSVHGEGRNARRIVEAARSKVAALVGASAKSVVFTSGATEANATALTPQYFHAGKPVNPTHLLVSAVEHPSALKSPRFSADVTRTIPVEDNGLIDLAALSHLLAEVADAGGVALVACQLANNETGVIQAIATVADIVHAAGGILHCDAVQAAGRIAIDIQALGVDSLSLSAHKIGGVQGVGALVLADGRPTPQPLLTGGGQEGWRRAGTEPVAAIAAFGAAADVARTGLASISDVAARRDRLQAELHRLSNRVIVFGTQSPRLPNTIALSLPGVSAETAVIAFDLAGIALSSGSACSSGKVTPSHVLKAMGVPPNLARGGLRISMGKATTDAEIERFVGVWARVMAKLTLARVG